MGKTSNVEATWVSGHRFVVTTASGHAMVLDNPSRPERAASPMELVLAAVAGCGGIDVVSILEKMRQPLERFEIVVQGQRRDEDPKIYTRLTIVFRVWGPGLDPDKVRRAVDLSVSTYCSVLAMLESGAEVQRRIELNGEVLDPH